MRHEAEVLAKTLVGLPTPGNDCGVAGSAPWRAGGFGPVAADPRKQNEFYIPEPHAIRVDDWYELDITASWLCAPKGWPITITSSSRFQFHCHN